MAIPDEYAVLFMQGGATMQFSMVPMNLAVKKRADYVVTGNFASSAAKEARKFLDVREAASSEADAFSYIPELSLSSFDPEADYVHITTNNTIFGTRYASIPDTGSVPLVADMSSNILSEVYDVSRFGLIYAGAQKNIGPAGVTVVIMRKDLLERSSKDLPLLLNYNTHFKGESLYNTPATWSVYVMMLVLRWLKAQGRRGNHGTAEHHESGRPVQGAGRIGPVQDHGAACVPFAHERDLPHGRRTR